MFIFKNAWRNITRARGRSILIGAIIAIIAFSVCIGLSIRQSAADAKTAALSKLNITAQISPNRDRAIKKARASGSLNFSGLKKNLGTSLSLSRLKKYAKAKAVKSFYYTLAASFDASGSAKAYSTSDRSGNSSKADSNAPKGMTTGDFSVVGYSSDEAMTAFTQGTSKITKGKMFTEGTSEMVCAISKELANYNNLSVGDSITLANPNASSETYTLKIVGIYKNSQSSAQAAGGMMQSDPANQILTSYNTLKQITATSKAKNSDNAVTGNLSGTYVVGSTAGYKAFKSQVKALGLSSKYAVSSSDIESYEQSAKPLENLSTFAGYFLVVILVIGAVILVVMNIFSTRERKYEIGVLSAVGMKKGKIAQLFMAEILILALFGVAIGGGLGAATSVPVTKKLLSVSVSTQQNQISGMAQNFGRSNNGGAPQGGPGQRPGSNAAAGDSSILNSISSGVNAAVVTELLCAMIALAAAAGAVSVVTIMRYKPLQILANRD
ncbi:ABC transporter permease [Pseudoramibacter faecis]|uniref:ABC transporter permease n=1 Tax=Pseudoramibacter faecis TaxID=3108534 RepID=UPI002E75E6B1|nr:ABC transporter permease [Pseudoramibacter sp. HA2172]